MKLFQRHDCMRQDDKMKFLAVHQQSNPMQNRMLKTDIELEKKILLHIMPFVWALFPHDQTSQPLPCPNTHTHDSDIFPSPPQLWQ